jgi:hypothetical protein
VNRFIDNSQTRHGTSISNYSAIANLCNSQITTAPAKHFPAYFVFTSRSLATASDNRNSSASRAQVLFSQTPIQNWLGRPSFLQDNSLAGITQKHPISNSASIAARRLVAAGTCLPSRRLETAPVYMLISLSLHSNGSTRYIIMKSWEYIKDADLVSSHIFTTSQFCTLEDYDLLDSSDA